MGEDRYASLTYLAVTSRLLDSPVSIAAKGPSSVGKSYMIDQVLSFFPATSFYVLSSMSEHALAYSSEPLKHRMLVIYEAAGLNSDLASYLVRSLLSEGCVRYETVEKTKEGMRARLIEREGPTGLIVTTTAVQLHAENETRLFSVTADDTPTQTRHVLRGLADEIEHDVDVNAWHELQNWIERTGHRRVTIPYGTVLADLVAPVAVRLRRDFGAVLSLIRAHALLHQASRDRQADDQIVATLEDYEVVRGIVAEIVAEGVQATVSATVRETVMAVADFEAPCSVADVARRLNLDESAASRRIAHARRRGFVVNEEDRRGRPARLRLGEPMPEEIQILPDLEALRDHCTLAVDSGGDK